MSWGDVLKMGAAKVAPADPPKPSDLSTVMYTSGTTGEQQLGICCFGSCTLRAALCRTTTLQHCVTCLLCALTQTTIASMDPAPRPAQAAVVLTGCGLAVPYAGDPKGVMITHANLVCAIAGCNQYLESFNETLGENDSYLSFLPLAHVFDRCGQTRECVESSSMLL